MSFSPDFWERWKEMLREEHKPVAQAPPVMSRPIYYVYRHLCETEAEIDAAISAGTVACAEAARVRGLPPGAIVSDVTRSPVMAGWVVTVQVITYGPDFSAIRQARRLEESRKPRKPHRVPPRWFR